MTKHKRMRTIAILTVLVSALGSSAIHAKDKYTVKVPGGLAFSEFRGYEGWHLISISQDGPLVAAILGNPAMIRAYEAGIPGNGKPVPDGGRGRRGTRAEDGGVPRRHGPGPLHDVDFMVKDSKRFGDSGGWGYGAFEYDSASHSFKPATTKDTPPQGNDAKCGFACHTMVNNGDSSHRLLEPLSGKRVYVGVSQYERALDQLFVSRFRWAPRQVLRAAVAVHLYGSVPGASSACDSGAVR